MLKATTDAQLFGQGIHEIAVAPVCQLGNKATLPDGRIYRYAKAGASALEVGKLMQSAVAVAAHQGCAFVSSVNAGASAANSPTTIVITLGAAAVTADQYAGGTLVVNAGTGIGQTFTILGHAAHAGSGPLTLTLVDDTIRVALSASDSKCSLTASPYSGVIIAPTTLTGVPVGVTPCAVTALYYFWIQTHGACGVLMDGTPAAGAVVSPSNGTAGAVESGVIGQGAVGMVINTGVNTEYQQVFLTID